MIDMLHVFNADGEHAFTAKIEIAPGKSRHASPKPSMRTPTKEPEGDKGAKNEVF